MQSAELIAAMATAPVGSAIGIVRLSGEGVRELIVRLLHRPDGRPRFASAAELSPRRIYHGLIHDGEGQPVDEVLVHLAFAPASYTGEDTAEISGHGGAACQRRLLDAVLTAGARHAGAGEFTRRAFLNGKLDLTRAEAVAELIEARGERLRNVAFARLRGSVAPAAGELRDALLDLTARVEAWIDFPEDDVDALELDALAEELATLRQTLDQAVDASRRHVILVRGADLAIVGRPNVGKSSLFNRFCGEERAIVDDGPGTTRDVVSETISLAGLPFALHDTAGLRDASGVEAAGVSRATALISQADLILAVFDGATPAESEDHHLLERTASRSRLLVVNRCDLPRSFDLPLPPGETAYFVSARTGEGIPALQEAILAQFSLAPPESLLATNARQLDCLEEAGRALADAELTARNHGTVDLIAEGIRQAARDLSRMLGLEYTEDLLDRIFSRFCIGK